MSIRTIAAVMALLVCSVSAQTELTTNGGFETGDFTGWQLFPSQPGNITIVGGNGSTFGANVANTLPASNSFMKHANLGAGQVMPGQAVTVSLDLKGVTAIGGIVFVQVFWEISGGGISGAQLLGPIFADPDPNTWTTHTFNLTAGSDVSGGVSVQLEAVTGGAAGSVSDVTYDNVSVTIPSGATYPGSGDDLTIGTGINGAPGGPDVKNAVGGDVLSVNVASPGGTYDLFPYYLVLQAPLTGNVGSFPGFPELHFDATLPHYFLVDPTLFSPIGPPVVASAGGTTTTYQLPTSLNGLGKSLVLQGVVLSPSLTIVATDANEIVIP